MKHITHSKFKSIEQYNNEPTRKVLISYIDETSKLMKKALKKYDKNSNCKIYPSLDMGFPHDVARIAGGFPTGILLKWNCNIPFIPVDTTVNVCSSSVFQLSNDISNNFTEEFLNTVINKINNSSSYEFNFHRGNHFISLCKGKNTYYLVMHSSASEFKKHYNGLYPVSNNWYNKDIKILHNGNRYLKYLIDEPAQLFHNIADQVHSFNRVRHQFIAYEILKDFCSFTEVSIENHYGMPNNQSILTGSYFLSADTIVPIFSNVGHRIYLIKIKEDMQNIKQLSDNLHGYLVPHGWGKYSKKTPLLKIKDNIFSLNDIEYPINTDSSLRDHPDLALRFFEDDVFLNLMRCNLNFEIVDILEQEVYYTKYGFTKK